MRNDYKPWKKVKRVGKQFGGALAAGTRPLARPLGFKGGKRVKKIHGGVLDRPVARPLGLKHGSKKPAKKA